MKYIVNLCSYINTKLLLCFYFGLPIQFLGEFPLGMSYSYSGKVTSGRGWVFWDFSPLKFLHYIFKNVQFFVFTKLSPRTLTQISNMMKILHSLMCLVASWQWSQHVGEEQYKLFIIELGILSMSWKCPIPYLFKYSISNGPTLFWTSHFALEIWKDWVARVLTPSSSDLKAIKLYNMI